MKYELFKKGLVLGIIMLFVGAGVIPSMGGTIVEKKSNYPISNGNTLYVGGSGPDNYTMIQDAIDNAINGDTVFVYDDLSPYYENVIVDKSINLIGENRDTTIIDGMKVGHVVKITADMVTVTGFTFQNCSREGYFGIWAISNYTRISENIVRDNTNVGIWVAGDTHYNVHNVISDNIIMDNTEGLMVGGLNHSISGNAISHNEGAGIWLEAAFFSNITRNIIEDNIDGIQTTFTSNNVFSHNKISNNKRYGIDAYYSSEDKIVQNNFINNKRNAIFGRFMPIEMIEKKLIMLEFNTDLLQHYQVFGRTIWNENFWDRPRLIPYPIFGRRGLIFNVVMIDEFFWFNSVTFDFHPAQEAYDIS